MYKLFGYGLKDIPYINRLKNRVFYIIVITIVSLNIFISFSLNLKKVSKETLINSFIIVDLQNNLDEEKRNDKSESFKNLQNELNISIPEASNPLTDSLIVSVKSAELMNGVQELIEAREEVKEVYKDEPYLKQSQEQSDIIHIAQIGSAVFSFLTALVTIVIFNLGVAIEFLNNANTGLDYAENIKESKFKNLIPFSMASVVATLIFFNIYVFFRKYVTNANFDSSLLSLREIFLWHIGAIAILNFLVWLIPANLGRIEYEEEKDDDLDYEFYEEETEDKKDEFYDEFEDDDI